MSSVTEEIAEKHCAKPPETFEFEITNTAHINWHKCGVCNQSMAKRDPLVIDRHFIILPSPIIGCDTEQILTCPSCLDTALSGMLAYARKQQRYPIWSLEGKNVKILRSSGVEEDDWKINYNSTWIGEFGECMVHVIDCHRGLGKWIQLEQLCTMNNMNYVDILKRLEKNLDIWMYKNARMQFV
jgi:hypothetical protein